MTDARRNVINTWHQKGTQSRDGWPFQFSKASHGSGMAILGMGQAGQGSQGDYKGLTTLTSFDTFADDIKVLIF